MTTTIVDSLAIKILNNKTILTGVGNELHYYYKQQNESGLSKRILDIKLENKVHGIVLDYEEQTQLLVFGEKEFVVLDSENFEFRELFRAQLSDWIIGAKFLKNINEFVLLTAHSVILRCAFENNKFSVIERSSCTDKSTLYCASIYGDCWNTLVVFGGNAFGELLVWQPSVNTLVKHQLKSTLLHRISAHNGVIFSIAYNAKSNILTTTSDDRSIRFWGVKVCNDNWTAAVFTALTSGYGHSARVFQAKIIENNEQTYIISVGEDSYICLWQSNGELLFKRRQQFGATIWNFDYDAATNTLYTVGSTGNCIAYNMEDVLLCKLNETSTLPELNTAEISKYVAKIKFINSQLLVGISNTNQLIYKDLEDQSDWQIVECFEAFKCTVLEIQLNMIALCGYKKLVLYEYQGNVNGNHIFVNMHNIVVLEAVIRSFQFLSKNKYLLSDELGNCVLLHCQQGSMQSLSIELPKCKERWLTAGLLVDNNYLLVSNRQGNLILYQIDTLTKSIQLKYILKHPHGNLGATLLKEIIVDKDKILVQSAGHDSSIKYLSIDKMNGCIKIIRREAVPVAWVEAVISDNDDSSERSDLLLGFNDNHFVVWSRCTDFLQQIPCGGGHRCWHYCLIADSKQQKWIKVVFIRNKQVILHSLKLHNAMIEDRRLPAHNTWHVKACNIARLINGNYQTIIVSAGEDNLIKILHYNLATKKLQQIVELHTHISNIRALTLKALNDREYLIFSAGGRAQLCINKLNINNFEVEELLNYMLTDKANHSSNYNFDPETRIMSIDTLKSEHEELGFLIFLACSDGFVRRLKWSQNTIHVEKELFYDKCVLQVRLIAGKHLLIATTDGLLHFYDLELKQSHLKLAQHSSGINALDLYIESATNILHILTGGDDQTVSYTCISLDTLQTLNTWRLEYQHTAQVTAACFALNTANVLFAYTSSIDQNVFKLDLSNGSVVAEFHSPVADVKGLCIDNMLNCYLYGCGLQIFNFKS